MQHIPACGSLRNLLLTISYDGKKFHGWQIQQNAMTVQEAFQTALSKIIGRDRVNSQSRAPSASFPLKPSPTKNVSLLSTREL